MTERQAKQLTMAGAIYLIEEAIDVNTRSHVDNGCKVQVVSARRGYVSLHCEKPGVSFSMHFRVPLNLEQKKLLTQPVYP